MFVNQRWSSWEGLPSFTLRPPKSSLLFYFRAAIHRVLSLLRLQRGPRVRRPPQPLAAAFARTDKIGWFSVQSSLTYPGTFWSHMFLLIKFM